MATKKQYGPKMMNYRDKQGRILFVTDGISRGNVWFTGYRRPNGATKKLTTAALPVRDTREEAQRDLDKYARAKGLEVITNVYQD